MIQVACVARGNEVAEARALAASLKRFHPDWPLTVLVMRGLRPTLRPDEEPFRFLNPSELRLPDIEPLLQAAPPLPLAALLRPLLVSHLLEEGADRVLLLSSAAEVLGPLDELVAELDAHDAVLVPRLTGTLPDDGHRPDGRDLIEAGEVDDGLVGIRDSEGARALLEWWTQRGHEAAEAAHVMRTTPGAVRPEARLGASPLAAARRVFGDLGWLEHPGYGVSHWNLHERRLERRGDELLASGQPLRVMHFPGFRADRPWWLSENGDRTLVLDDPILTDLCRRRARALLDAGWIVLDELASDRPELPNGLIFDERLRRLHAESLDEGEDFGEIFTPAGAEAFASWLSEPAPHGERWGINRYSYDLWRQRPDVQEAYPDLDGADGEGFVGWLWIHGRPEMHLQPPLLPPAPPGVDGLDRRLPAVVVTGFLRGNLGLGEAARGYVNALRAADVPVETRAVATDLPNDLPRRRTRGDERDFEDLTLADEHPFLVDLVCVNADQLPGLMGDVGARADYVIGHWAWETDVVPESWEPAFELVDELWVNSSYVAENLARAGAVPVVVVPTPVEAPDPAGTAVPFAVPDGFVFLFVFDFFSTVARKNPVGLVEAFTRAFRPGEGPTLLLKTINADFRPEARERLRYAIGDRPDVMFVDRSLTPPEMAALFSRADCYVSLHRSEGFGITLAESMALGKPVIGTGFSGNTDFMTPLNSYLVDWTPATVGFDAEHYPPDGTWAEPSVEHAAELMREVWEDQEGARARGERAARDVAATLSPAAVGAIGRARLERIGSLHGAESRSSAVPYPLSEVPRRLRFPIAGGNSGPRGFARRALLRALRPYTAPERALDEAVAASLEKLYVELRAERAASERDRQRIARLEQRIAELTRRSGG